MRSLRRLVLPPVELEHLSQRVERFSIGFVLLSCRQRDSGSRDGGRAVVVDGHGGEAEAGVDGWNRRTTREEEGGRVSCVREAREEREKDTERRRESGTNFVRGVCRGSCPCGKAEERTRSARRTRGRGKRSKFRTNFISLMRGLKANTNRCRIVERTSE